MTTDPRAQAIEKAAIESERILSLSDGEGARARFFTDVSEDAAVRELCERHGYGAVMDSAARQWYLKDPNGAITTGSCAATVRGILKELRAALALPHDPTTRELREAVRVLGMHCRNLQEHSTDLNEVSDYSKADAELKTRHTATVNAVNASDIAVQANPIASAAVKGAQI